VWCDVMWCDVIAMWCDSDYWCDVMWCGMMWCLVMWCDVMWCAEFNVMDCDVMLNLTAMRDIVRVVPCRKCWTVMWYHKWLNSSVVLWCYEIIWCDMMWCDVMWCDVIVVVWCDVMCFDMQPCDDVVWWGAMADVRCFVLHLLYIFCECAVLWFFLWCGAMLCFLMSHWCGVCM
jgi:hypothetical protein